MQHSEPLEGTNLDVILCGLFSFFPGEVFSRKGQLSVELEMGKKNIYLHSKGFFFLV